jgi:DNA polymerase III sliding clamp (beta) subunit (PCNA family)
MEFKILVDEMQSVLSRLSHVVRLNEEDVTSMIMVEAGDEVEFKATDGSTYIVITNEAEIIKKGKALLRLRDIKGYVAKFVPLMGDYGTKDFHFVVEDSKGLIKTKTQFQSGKPSYRKLKFQTFKENFPAAKSFEDPDVILNSVILKQGINRVLHCVNSNEVRRALTGINVTIDAGRVVFAGANGVKLAEFGFNTAANIERKSYILSYELASILRAILDDDAQVFMKFEGRYAYVKSNNVYIVGGLIINESYPDYKSMFELTRTLSIPRLDFSDTVNTVMDVLDPEDNRRLSITFAGSSLTLKNDLVETTQDFEEPFLHELDIDVNGEYLDSILRDFSGNMIDVHFTPGNSYIVFKGEDENHTALLSVVKRR